MFGEPLASVLASEGKPTDGGVPHIAERCTSFLLGLQPIPPKLVDAALLETTSPSDGSGVRSAMNVIAQGFRRRAHCGAESCAFVGDGSDPVAVLLVLRLFVSKCPDALLVPRTEGAFGRVEAAATLPDAERRKAFSGIVEKELSPQARSLLACIVAFSRRLVAAKVASIASMCSLFARALGHPKTKGELQTCAKMLASLIRGGIPKVKAPAPSSSSDVSSRAPQDHPADSAASELAAAKAEIERLRVQLREAEARALAAETLVVELQKRLADPAKALSEALLRRKLRTPPATAAPVVAAAVASSSGRLVTARKAAPAHRRSPSRNLRQTQRELEAKAEQQRETAPSTSSEQQAMSRARSLGGMAVLAAVGSGGQPSLLHHRAPPKSPRKSEPSAEVPLKSPRRSPCGPPSPRRAVKSSAAPTELVLTASISQAEAERFVEQGFSSPKLICIQGRRRVRCHVVELSWKSLCNAAGAFVLDAGSILFLWKGANSNRMETAKALDVCTRIRDKERSSRARILRLDESTEDTEFWKLLGGKHAIASDSGVVGPAQEFEDVLFRVELTSGTPTARQIAKNDAVRKELLDKFSCFLVDSENEVYCWLGSKATPPLRKSSLILAVQLLQSRPRIQTARVQKISEGMETILFKERFFNWPDTLPINGPQPVRSACSRVDMESFDVTKMLAPAQPPKEPSPPDEGTGRVKGVWRMREFGKVPVPEALWGQFFSGASYLVLYSYTIRWRECFVIFFWQGRTSSTTDKGTSAYLAVDLDEKFQNEAKQVRVVQGQEPLHFLLVFRGRYIVHRGEHEDGAGPPGDVQLYHTASAHSRGVPHSVHVLAEVCALNANDSFILQDRQKQFIWHGKHSQQATRDCAVAHAAVLRGTRRSAAVSEGKEPSAFWELLGGHGAYFAEQRQPQRFFHCSNASGRFEALEVAWFSQADLIPDDCAILDTGTTVFVWEGKKANEDEKRKTLEVGIEYARRRRLGALFVQQGHEPLAFRASFSFYDTSTLLGENAEAVPAEEVLDKYNRAYTLSELQTHPKHLDQTRLESYLSDTDFRAVFGMNKEEFEGQSGWAKEKAKKKAGLY